MTPPSRDTGPDLWQCYGARRARADRAAGVDGTFHWDWYQRNGPGAEILGSLDGIAVIEVGAGTGRQAAHLARSSTASEVTALDSSASMYERCRRSYGDVPRLRAVLAEAASHLAERPSAFDLVYSVFGALDFTDPRRLLPAVAASLRPGGMLVFSTLGHYRNGEAAERSVRSARLPTVLTDGTPVTLERWVLDLPLWERLLAQAGLDVVDVETVHDAGRGRGLPMTTRIIRATRPAVRHL
ncbi:class I SAM-dependent methyltransferase [Streptomyces sp. WMMC500]|uniref:class I SAM-dependent methyltransferase n=1 Tax=Streptomyces sp. WMMC500 TaxID=3015154 RepID=UPI00248B0EA6|nr:class I SAM-dependent methyltransferase [Streptomyces sp. WMMC500]WBB59781.1 class I SAM-dependent methyltransferase [Streptomyces sp. WMMC500]